MFLLCRNYIIYTSSTIVKFTNELTLYFAMSHKRVKMDKETYCCYLLACSLFSEYHRHSNNEISITFYTCSWQKKCCAVETLKLFCCWDAIKSQAGLLELLFPHLENKPLMAYPTVLQQQVRDDFSYAVASMVLCCGYCDLKHSN